MRLFVLLCTMSMLMFASCLMIGCGSPPPPPPPIVDVDTEPIGSGLRFIGIAAVICVILLIIGSAVMEDMDE